MESCFFKGKLGDRMGGSDKNKESIQALQAHLVGHLGSYIERTSYGFGQLECFVHANKIPVFLDFAKKDAKCRFELLLDICGVDNPGAEYRFQVVYHLLSIHHNHRLRVICNIKDGLSMPSVETIFRCASWFEREVWDMYGIKFQGNKDLRRILTDYEFEGHPLRKDFPLTGYKEVKYDPETKRVVYTPVNLTQQYRDFDFSSPWEGMQDPNRLLKRDEERDG